jgi:hypothetical protein
MQMNYQNGKITLFWNFIIQNKKKTKLEIKDIFKMKIGTV